MLIANYIDATRAAFGVSRDRLLDKNRMDDRGVRAFHALALLLKSREKLKCKHIAALFDRNPKAVAKAVAAARRRVAKDLVFAEEIAQATAHLAVIARREAVTAKRMADTRVYPERKETPPAVACVRLNDGGEPEYFKELRKICSVGDAKFRKALEEGAR